MLVKLPTEDTAYPFSVEVEVRLIDTSGGTHLGNHVMVNYMNEAMIKLYQAMGFPLPVINGISFIQRELSISFLTSASYGDRIQVCAAIESFEESQYTKIFRLYNLNSKREVAHIRALFVSFDYKEGKMVSVPEKLKEAYGALTDTR